MEAGRSTWTILAGERSAPEALSLSLEGAAERKKSQDEPTTHPPHPVRPLLGPSRVGVPLCTPPPPVAQPRPPHPLSDTSRALSLAPPGASDTLCTKWASRVKRCLESCDVSGRRLLRPGALGRPSWRRPPGCVVPSLAFVVLAAGGVAAGQGRSDLGRAHSGQRPPHGAALVRGALSVDPGA
eukprot:scaffold2017_cov387-Prasinococcus_capsulatus_cf.AAC.22